MQPLTDYLRPDQRAILANPSAVKAIAAGRRFGKTFMCGLYILEIAKRGAASWLDAKRLGIPHLPQGAPTSPALANLCAAGLFAILIAANLQTAWLSPPVALSAYSLKGVAPQWALSDIYRGMMQFMVLQIIALALVICFAQLVLWLPGVLYTR